MLSQQPPGTFLIRPHDTKEELYYLSFASDDAEKVKHAVIRKEIVEVGRSAEAGLGTPSSSHSPGASADAPSIVYKCGKVGPCGTIEELIQYDTPTLVLTTYLLRCRL